ncbi:hypothetical protein DPMN_159377 [Dreissena polymorpha]|uniref:Uncharacterized protein n=1 Tax=Dreissena polymorpha TaxID=45954 RepID=A0A9D4EKZ4_DREPO|nr:hypothetical protein DPMN_159377 [Dreissena polymorpha]
MPLTPETAMSEGFVAVRSEPSSVVSVFEATAPTVVQVSKYCRKKTCTSGAPHRPSCPSPVGQFA